MCYKPHMPRKNSLSTTPPAAVEAMVVRLGANLRAARLARNLTVAEMAEKIGTGRRAVMDAESGKPGTSIAVYAALLWAHNLAGPFADLADPAADTEGLARVHGERNRASGSGKGKLDNDF